MKVDLLTHTPDPLRLAYCQTRGTTTNKGFAEVYRNPERFFPKAVREELKNAQSDAERESIAYQEMTRVVIDEAMVPGHMSVTRGLTFTFAFEMSRAAGRQHLRHVVGVAHEEQSQRYTKIGSDEYIMRLQDAVSSFHPYDIEEGVLPQNIKESVYAALSEAFELPEWLKTASSSELLGWTNARLGDIVRYRHELDVGIPAEEARDNLPECTKTHIISTFSFEALQNYLAKRLCDRAQLPIRTLAKEMRKQVLQVVPWTSSQLGIQCSLKGYCPEARPGACPLHFNNGGKFLSKDQMEEAARLYRSLQK